MVSRNWCIYEVDDAVQGYKNTVYAKNTNQQHIFDNWKTQFYKPLKELATLDRGWLQTATSIVLNQPSQRSAIPWEGCFLGITKSASFTPDVNCLQE
jgi:hypothetical protein